MLSHPPGSVSDEVILLTQIWTNDLDCLSLSNLISIRKKLAAGYISFLKETKVYIAGSRTSCLALRTVPKAQKTTVDTHNASLLLSKAGKILAIGMKCT